MTHDSPPSEHEQLRESADAINRGYKEIQRLKKENQRYRHALELIQIISRDALSDYAAPRVSKKEYEQLQLPGIAWDTY